MPGILEHRAICVSNYIRVVGVGAVCNLQLQLR
uniref:Uncharacterized protein n=1 Tax=Arundo donax TaxID=35708 RepID=A0A0A9DWN4_ARUDO